MHQRARQDAAPRAGLADALGQADGLAPGDAGDAARIARLFEMTSDLLATMSLDGRFTLLNPAWELVLGWSRDELLAKPMQELLHPDDVEQTLSLMLAGSRQPAHLENFTNRYRHRDGSWRWFEITCRSRLSDRGAHCLALPPQLPSHGARTASAGAFSGGRRRDRGGATRQGGRCECNRYGFEQR